MRPEPVLDIARGLSVFTSGYICVAQVVNIWKELFIDRCEYCKGAGRVICKHCGGTKTLRRRPGEYHDVQSQVVDRKVEDVYQCVHCGPLLVYDLVKEAADTEREAIEIMDNVKDAYAGRLRKHRTPILAGTVPCPQCANNPRILRHTPNYARVFRVEVPLWTKVNQRVGAYLGSSSQRPVDLVEYPSRQPHVDDLDPEHIIDVMRAEYDMKRADWEEKEGPIAQWRLDAAKEERSPLEPRPWDKPPEESPGVQKLKQAHQRKILKFVDDSDSDMEEDEQE